MLIKIFKELSHISHVLKVKRKVSHCFIITILSLKSNLRWLLLKKLVE